MSTDNPNAFKHWINDDMLGRLTKALRYADKNLDVSILRTLAVDLAPLELKPRVRFVRDRLHDILPKNFESSIDILVRACESSFINGFDLWPLTEYVQAHGLNHFDVSFAALHSMTQLFTAEFAVRPFIAKEPKKALAILKRWSKDKNHHVRRCASEGSRPRLPWGEKIPYLAENPEETLPILENLFLDKEIYVRKSVANHLNDWSKIDGDLLTKTLKRWQSMNATIKQKTHTNRAHLEWVTKHALRTLIKQGDVNALQLVGVKASSDLQLKTFSINRTMVAMGEALNIEAKIINANKKPVKAVIDYVLYFRKANGSLSAKVFKWKTGEFLPGTTNLSKKHKVKPVTTRVYYNGEQGVSLKINGKETAVKKWVLAE